MLDKQTKKRLLESKKFFDVTVPMAPGQITAVDTVEWDSRAAKRIQAVPARGIDNRRAAVVAVHSFQQPGMRVVGAWSDKTLRPP